MNRQARPMRPPGTRPSRTQLRSVLGCTLRSVAASHRERSGSLILTGHKAPSITARLGTGTRDGFRGSRAHTRRTELSKTHRSGIGDFAPKSHGAEPRRAAGYGRRREVAKPKLARPFTAEIQVRFPQGSQSPLKDSKIDADFQAISLKQFPGRWWITSETTARPHRASLRPTPAPRRGSRTPDVRRLADQELERQVITVPAPRALIVAPRWYDAAPEAVSAGP